MVLNAQDQLLRGRNGLRLALLAQELAVKEWKTHTLLWATTALFPLLNLIAVLVAQSMGALSLISMPTKQT